MGHTPYKAMLGRTPPSNTAATELTSIELHATRGSAEADTIVANIEGDQ